jgi:hypothetical protein
MTKSQNDEMVDRDPYCPFASKRERVRNNSAERNKKEFHWRIENRDCQRQLKIENQ